MAMNKFIKVSIAECSETSYLHSLQLSLECVARLEELTLLGIKFIFNLK